MWSRLQWAIRIVYTSPAKQYTPCKQKFELAYGLLSSESPILQRSSVDFCAFHLADIMLEVNLVFCACICLSFFYAIVDFSCNCFFSWYARDAGFSHMYSEHYVVLRPFWGGVGAGSAIYNWLLFQYLLQDNFFFWVLNWSNFVLRVKGFSGVSLLPSRLSS